MENLQTNEIPIEVLVSLICEDYLYNTLKPLLLKEGREVGIDKLQMRSRFKRSFCERIVDFLLED